MIKYTLSEFVMKSEGSHTCITFPTNTESITSGDTFPASKAALLAISCRSVAE